MTQYENTFEDLIDEIDGLLAESTPLATTRSTSTLDDHKAQIPATRSPRQKATIEDLIGDIDAYLAEQAAYQSSHRRNSCGTMFVDFDENGPPIVSWRHPKPDTDMPEPGRLASGPPTKLQDKNMEVRYSQDSNLDMHPRMYVQGHDPDTKFNYDYDGRVMHVHRKNPSIGSQYSEYYNVDAQKVASKKPFRIVDKDLPPTPNERRRRGKVVKFICKLLDKLEINGLLDQFKTTQSKQGKPAQHSQPRRGPRASPREYSPAVRPKPLPYDAELQVAPLFSTGSNKRPIKGPRSPRSHPQTSTTRPNQRPQERSHHTACEPHSRPHAPASSKHPASTPTNKPSPSTRSAQQPPRPQATRRPEGIYRTVLTT